MEQLFEVFERELTARYPKGRGCFEEQKTDLKERHFFLEYPDFDLDIAFMKYPAPGVRHLLACRVYEKNSPVFVPYGELLFAMRHEKRYEHVEFCFIATEAQMSHAIDALVSHIDCNIATLLAVLKDREEKKRLFGRYVEGLNIAYGGMEVVRYEADYFIASDEFEIADIERMIEHYYRSETVKKYNMPYLSFLKGDVNKGLEKLAESRRKDAELSAIAELPPEAVQISSLAVELYQLSHKSAFRVLLAEAASWMIGSFFLALPTYVILVGIYLLAAGALNDGIVFSTALSGIEVYFYPILPALFSGVLATAFSGKLCYRFLYAKGCYRAYYRMMVSEIQKKFLRILVCFLIAVMAGISYLGGAAGTIFEEHRMAHTEFLSLREQYYSYEHLEKVVLSGEKADVELHFENGEILPLYDLSVKGFKLHLEEFLKEKGIEIKDES